MFITVLTIAILSVASVVFLTIYFMPVLVAYIRGHKNILAISLMTLFLGWTLYGWIAALLWSLNCDIEEDKEDKSENNT